LPSSGWQIQVPVQARLPLDLVSNIHIIHWPALPHAQAAHFLSSALLCNHAGLSVYVGMCSLVKVTVIVICCFLHCVKEASLAVGV
jgi:hypothetical protein